MISNLFKSDKKKKSKENIQTNNKNQTKKKKEDFYIKNNVSMVDKLLGKAYLLLEKNNINLEKEKVRESSQDTIQYEKMLPSGICKIDNDTYSKTIEFFDINYQLAQNDDKNRIFESYCEFLNYFDSTISFQLLFVNKRSDLLDLKENIIIEEIEQQEEKEKTDLQNKNIIVLGGKWNSKNRGEVESYIDFKNATVEFIEANRIFRNSEKIKNKDIVIFDTSYNSHSAFYKVKSLTDNLLYINKSNIEEIKKSL